MAKKEAKKKGEYWMLHGENDKVKGLASTSFCFKVALHQVAMGAPIGAALGETTSTRLHFRWLGICSTVG